MAEPQTTGELFKAKEILDEDIAAAVDAFMANPTGATAIPLGEGYELDAIAAVAASKFAREAMVSPDASDHLKRAAVRTAILLARL